MANIQSANCFYVDSASSASVAASYVQLTPVLVTCITFTSSAAGDSVVICDMAPGSTPTQGPNKITIRNGVASDTKTVRFSPGNLLMFANGVWIASISAGATATLLGTSQGSG
jgi:hypothetical protein